MSSASRPTGYSLNELTQATGVTPRTVRYYVSEGLLPPPVAAGPRSHYTESHLQRLRLIGHLKDAYLPLREIRRRLQALSDDDVAGAIAELEAAQDDNRAPQQAGRAPVVEDRAPSYEPVPEDDDRQDEAAAPPYDQLRPQTWPFVASRPGEYSDPVPQEPAWRLPQPIKSAGRTMQRGTIWRKLEISEAAEFLIEERLYQRRKEQIDALLAWAQRILES
jgi:DNA-binding transcriptional MerR regulator